MFVLFLVVVFYRVNTEEFGTITSFKNEWKAINNYVDVALVGVYNFNMTSEEESSLYFLNPLTSDHVVGYSVRHENDIYLLVGTGNPYDDKDVFLLHYTLEGDLVSKVLLKNFPDSVVTTNWDYLLFSYSPSLDLFFILCRSILAIISREGDTKIVNDKVVGGYDKFCITDTDAQVICAVVSETNDTSTLFNYYDVSNGSKSLENHCQISYSKIMGYDRNTKNLYIEVRPPDDSYKVISFPFSYEGVDNCSYTVQSSERVYVYDYDVLLFTDLVLFYLETGGFYERLKGIDFHGNYVYSTSIYNIKHEKKRNLDIYYGKSETIPTQPKIDVKYSDKPGVITGSFEFSDVGHLVTTYNTEFVVPSPEQDDVFLRYHSFGFSSHKIDNNSSKNYFWSLNKAGETFQGYPFLMNKNQLFYLVMGPGGETRLQERDITNNFDLKQNETLSIPTNYSSFMVGLYKNSYLMVYTCEFAFGKTNYVYLYDPQDLTKVYDKIQFPFIEGQSDCLTLSLYDMMKSYASYFFTSVPNGSKTRIYRVDLDSKKMIFVDVDAFDSQTYYLRVSPLDGSVGIFDSFRNTLSIFDVNLENKIEVERFKVGVFLDYWIGKDVVYLLYSDKKDVDVHHAKDYKDQEYMYTVKGYSLPQLECVFTSDVLEFDFTYLNAKRDTNMIFGV